jgi:hypothetical protein
MKSSQADHQQTRTPNTHRWHTHAATYCVIIQTRAPNTHRWHTHAATYCVIIQTRTPNTHRWHTHAATYCVIIQYRQRRWHQQICRSVPIVIYQKSFGIQEFFARINNFCKETRFNVRKIYYYFSNFTFLLRKMMFSRLLKNKKYLKFKLYTNFQLGWN